ncbi:MULTISPECIES: 16S rRNA (uracil(1498)-N(3))-methyltransferase [unclassified Synechococcus]|uniref:16S rRNA (uracil(1498)-N(3))-methyltransferase n=1 Tax=unclassified Synechococcus TaxID=2626047 RepID=UPI0020CE0FC3|nr:MULTISPECIES: 16S rRNA (uracil(1498)-N(3))-methyltransferase [unclassified Synechococcus]
MRELRRLLIAPERLAAGPTLALVAEESRYLSRVLRYGPGQRFAVADGRGQLWSAVLLAGSEARLEQPLDQPLQRQEAASPWLELAVAVPRLDFDVVVRMACELGVDRLQPLVAEHGANRGSWKANRWQTILREACEQCERLWLPQLLEPLEAITYLSELRSGLSLLASTRDAQLPLVGAALAQGASFAAAGVALAIGAEGGWSTPETAAAQAAGWQAVSLGPHILRTSTAAVAGLASLVQWRDARGQQLSGRACRSPFP